jgi:Cu+-exporting ATPase
VYVGIDGEAAGSFTLADRLRVTAGGAVESLHRQGLRTILLTGDGEVVARGVAESLGINDAAALATADLGLAVVTGTDIALKSADIILVREDLRVIPDAIALARRTRQTIHGNLIWAFGYNLAAVPIAAAGLLNPLIAAAAMSLSSLFVTYNSLRLRDFGTEPDAE